MIAGETESDKEKFIIDPDSDTGQIDLSFLTAHSGAVRIGRFAIVGIFFTTLPIEN